MVRSSKRSGHSPFKAVMLGSSPARITNMIRYSSGLRGQSANLLVAGWRQKLQPIKCNCPVGSCSRRLDGAKPLFSHKRKCKSNPARISTRSLRLVGQDASLSSWKYGFESRRDHQSVRHIGIGQRYHLFFRNYNRLIEPRCFGEHPYHFATSVCHKQVGHFLSAGGSVFAFKFAHLQGILVINDILD